MKETWPILFLKNSNYLWHLVLGAWDEIALSERYVRYLSRWRRDKSTRSLKIRDDGHHTEEATYWKTYFIFRTSDVLADLPVATQSKTWVCGRSLAGIVGSNPAGCCVLTGRCLCDGPIPRPKESYRVRERVSLSVIICNKNPPHLQRAGRKRSNSEGKKGNVVLFLLGDSPASEFCAEVLEHSVRDIITGGVSRKNNLEENAIRWNRQCVPKRRHIKFRRRGNTQNKEYNIQDTAKVWNQEE